MNACPHCGMIHQTTCPKIKAIEYHENGVTVRKIEFHSPRPVASAVPAPVIFNPNISNTYGSSALSNACDQDEGA